MATTPSTTVPDLIDANWEQLSADERLHAVERLAENGEPGQQALRFIAHNDTDELVCCAAARQLTTLPELLALQSGQATVAEAATQQYYRVVAGTIETGVGEAERLEIIRTLPLPAAKQIALLAKCKAAGSEAVARIQAPEELADLSLFATSVHVRKEATLRIEDTALLNEIRDKVRDKDKTVFKLIEKRLGTSETTISSVTVAKSEPSTPAADSAPDKTSAADAVSTPKTKPPKKAKPAAELEPAPDPAAELPRLDQLLRKLSHKHTEALNSARNSLNKVRKAAAAASPELDALATSLHERVNEKLEKNRAHQEQLQQATTELLQQLQQALDAGQSHDALPTWDKIQGNISNTSGKIRTGLQKLANVHKAKLNELRDWRAFAATEKKKELLTQMQHLIDSKMHAADRSKLISKMHQEWKSLGRSNQNEQLWREFKKLSDKAYEPCKEYFKQRKQMMAANFTKRREICDRLEAELGQLSADELRVSDVNKLLHEAEQEWKTHAPIEQSKIKALQKRYFAAVNQLRKLRKNSLRGNGTQKQEFIDQANALVKLEDRSKAMSEAKRLQQEWKKIGPTSFKEDKKYWNDFRSACDKIFEKRNKDVVEQRDKGRQAESQLGHTLQSLENLFALNEEAFREARSHYHDLAQQFSNALDPRAGQQTKRLQEQFNGLKRKIDARYKALPDKKRVQLKQNVQEKAGILQSLETQLMNCTDTLEFAAMKDSFDRSAWDAKSTSGDARYDKALEERLQRLLKAQSAQSLLDAATKCAAKVRALCIELEIRANLDTPDEDQGLRMQIQLDQLKQGFGRQKPDPKENSLFALDAELQCYCLGPMDESIQKHLTPRIEGAIRKLL